METPLEKTPQIEPSVRPEIDMSPERTPSKTPRIVKMKPFLSRIQPVKGVFSPGEELQEIWTLPTGQRKEAVVVFKDKLARQREAWALCRTAMEERIEKDPDLPREKAFGILRQFASHYGFAQPELRFASRFINNYFIARARTLKTRSKHPDDLDLIHHLTGIKFSEREREALDVSVGPISIDIATNEINASRIYNKSSRVIPNSPYAGFASVSKTSPPIYYTVLNTDAWHKDKFLLGLVLAHEHEHVKYNLFPKPLQIRTSVGQTPQQMPDRGVLGFLHKQVLGKVFNFEKPLEGQLWERYTQEKDPDRQQILLEEYFKLKRLEALDRAKSEILAMKKGVLTGSDYERFFAQDRSPYDYLAFLRDHPSKKSDPIWQETSQKILVNEYRKIIESADQAFDQLSNQGGYITEEIIAIFTDKSLSEWPKTAKRLLEQKGKL